MFTKKYCKNNEKLFKIALLYDIIKQILIDVFMAKRSVQAQ